MKKKGNFIGKFSFVNLTTRTTIRLFAVFIIITKSKKKIQNYLEAL